MVPVTFGTQVTAEYDADGAGRHLANLRRRSGMSEAAERAVLGGEALDVAIGYARAALAALLAVAEGDEGSPLIALYLVLALRDRQRLLPTPADALALSFWSQRLLSFSRAG